MFIVAIDGPAGSGKGTIAKAIAERLGFLNIDTGAMYRCITLAMIKNNIKIEEEDKIKEILDTCKIEFKYVDGKKLVYLNDEDVTSEIRSNEVNKLVSPVSSLKFVRIKLVELQRKFAEKNDVVMEGRDIGTYVFPNANIKIYLDAKPEERARRRQKQNEEAGIKSTYEEVLENILARDENDKNKEMGALKQAEDAIYVDVTTGTVEENVQRVIDIINKKKDEKIESNDVGNDKKIKKNKKKDNSKEPIFKIIGKDFVRYTLIVVYKLLYRVKVIGKENVPKKDEGPFILCGNHVIPFKVPIIELFTTGRRRVYFVGKAELLKNPFMRILGYLFDVIPVKRGAKDMTAMKSSLKVLNNGDVLGIFPEGTTNGLQKKVRVKTGTAFMAIRTGCKVLPVGIKNAKFGKVIVNIGKPIDFKDRQEKNPEKELLESTTKEIMNKIIMLTETAK